MGVELIVSISRLGGFSFYGSASSRKPISSQRLRHFMSVRLTEDSPVDEIVARFLSLDQVDSVESVEIGSNCSREGKSRDHQLGFMITFADRKKLKMFLVSEDRATFLSSIEPYVSDEFVFDFESGVVG